MSLSLSNYFNAVRRWPDRPKFYDATPRAKLGNAERHDDVPSLEAKKFLYPLDMPLLICYHVTMSETACMTVSAAEEWVPFVLYGNRT